MPKESQSRSKINNCKTISYLYLYINRSSFKYMIIIDYCCFKFSRLENIMALLRDITVATLRWEVAIRVAGWVSADPDQNPAE